MAGQQVPSIMGLQAREPPSAGTLGGWVEALPVFFHPAAKFRAFFKVVSHASICVRKNH